MPMLIFAESPMDPLRIARHWPDAGLAYEKHRWQFELRDAPVHSQTILGYDYSPLREIYVHRLTQCGVPFEAIPLANWLAPDAIPLPPLHFAAVADPEGGVPAAIEMLVAEWPRPVYLVLSQALIPPFDPPPRHTNQLLSHVGGRRWQESANPAWMLLPDVGARSRAVGVLGIKGFHRLYLVAGPTDPSTIPVRVHELFASWNGLTRIEEPSVDYAAFHALVSSCDWVLTTHNHVAGTTAFCSYSLTDLRPTLRRFAPDRAGGLVETDDIAVFNLAAGVTVAPRGGLTLSDIMPPGMVEGRTELSLAWSDLDRLDELPTLSMLRQVDLDGTLIDDLAPLARMPALERVSLRCLQLKDLRPLARLPALRHVALSRIPAAGLSALAEMPALTSLDLDRLPIADGAALVGCRRVTDLSLNHTPLTHIRDVARMASLEQLSLAATRLDAIEPLSALPALDRLVLDGVVLPDLASLPSFPAVTTLSLSGLGAAPLAVPDPAPIAAMPRLKHLRLANTTVETLSRGPADQTLESLDLSLSRVSDLHWLANLEALRDLRLAETAGINVQLLADLTSLETLDLSFCGVGALRWLGRLSRLRELHLRWTSIVELSALVELSNLRSLHLGGAVVAEVEHPPMDVLVAVLRDASLEELDLSGWRLGATAWPATWNQVQVLSLARTDLEDTGRLRGMTRLVDLNLAGTPLRSIEGLAEAHQLRRLNLAGTRVEHLDALRGASELQVLSLRGTPVGELRPLAGLPQLRRLDLRGIAGLDADLRPLLDLPRLLLLLDGRGGNEVVLRELMKRHRVVISPT